VVHDNAEADDLLLGETGHRCPYLLRQLRSGVADPSDHRLGAELGDQVGLEVVPSSVASRGFQRDHVGEDDLVAGTEGGRLDDVDGHPEDLLKVEDQSGDIHERTRRLEVD
jgi:hypothetical protein